MNIQKVIVISSIVSANVVVWYEVFGMSFLIVLGAIGVCLVVFLRGR